MRVFISQPMKDKTNEEIKNERQAIIEAINAKYGNDAEIVDSFFEGSPAEAKPLWFLGKSLEMLSTADKVWFGAGWQDARGCKMEHTACLEYGIEIVND